MGLLDAGFWYLEDTKASLHIASVTVFEGPRPDFDEFRTAVERKLPAMPRYRMKMQPVMLGIARPAWIDDTGFDLDFHVRRTAVPAPGSPAELCSLVDRLMSNPLDTEHPLWEAWFVEGMQDDQWAVVWKVHHSMVDGVGGMALLANMLDCAPDSLLPPPRGWRPRREPSTARMVTAALGDQLRVAASSFRTAGSLVRNPVATSRKVGALAQGFGRYSRAARPVDPTSLLGTIDRSRHFTWTSVDFAEVAAVRRALGGSVNDVVLAIVTCGLRELLIERGDVARAHSMRCLIPVSVRDPNESTDQDNKISALLADLPVHIEHPRDVYDAVTSQTHELKSSHEAAAGQLAVDIAEHLPAGVVAASMRSVLRLPQRFLSTVVTNVPGPQFPLYLLGRRMVSIYPYVPIADQLRVGVAVTSYNGQLFFGITTDRDSVPNAEALSRGIVRSLGTLAEQTLVPSV